MTEIFINEATPSSRFLERIRMFPGRHLGEDEFDRLQAYSDARMAPLLTGHQPGILNGLELRGGEGNAPADTFTVSSGMAVAGNGQALGLYYPLSQRWRDVIQVYLNETGADDAVGLYYLTLRRSSRHVDADPETDPCQRLERDPRRDSRLVVAGSIGLRRLSVSAAAVGSESRERLENMVAANRVDGRFLTDISNAVPLALVALVADGEGYRPLWFSVEAGRYLAVKNSGYQVMLRQTRSAFDRMVKAAAASEQALGDFLQANLRLDYLPAAGALPRGLLQGPASASPQMRWLPSGLGLDMVAVPESTVPELLQRHLPRRVVNLRRPRGTRLRLLLSVSDRDYRPDLLDIPQLDSQLGDELHRYFMRSYNAWADWRRGFDELYALLDADSLDSAELEALGLPRAIVAPPEPAAVYQALIDRASKTLVVEDSGGLPHPFDQEAPAGPGFYKNWLEDGEVPTVPDAQRNGLVVRYAIARWELEALDNQVRAIRARLDKTRDYLMLQRQHLDTQTVALASLAGGVAGDGSGLQVARWLPFTKFTTQTATPPPSEEPTATNGSSSTDEAGVDGARLDDSAPYRYEISKLSKYSYQQPVVMETSRALLNEPKLFSSTLRLSPDKLSSVQYSLNSDRLSRLASVPKQTLTTPSFEAKAFRFGVLEHVLPEAQEYKKAYRGMRELIATLDGMFDIADAKSLKDKLEDFGKPESPESLAEKDEEASTGDAETDKQNGIQARYEALFKAGQLLVKQIAFVEARYGRIEALLEGKLRKGIRLEANIDKLAALIEKATKDLQSLDKRRVERLGDYGVAQRLVEEDWQSVFEAGQARAAILTRGLRGLYYIRVQEAPLSLPLADPLPLRHHAPGDIVPGCDTDEDAELPEELEAFFETVLEVPVSDWPALATRTLPGTDKLRQLLQRRELRLQASRVDRRLESRGLEKIELMAVSQQSLSLSQVFAQKRLPSWNNSLSRFQRESADVLSLEDVLGGTQGALRRRAQQLRDRLEQCLCCMLQRLDSLPPSLRLQWSELAQEDDLKVEWLNQWPGLERAEREDFNVTRTLAELVQWWFRQIDDEASAAGRSAMRNMIRAILIHSALGDPADSIKGTVAVPPRMLAVGEALRLKLDRQLSPGATLQLLDVQQRSVALLSIEDHDGGGTTAKISKVQRQASVDTRYTVVSSKLMQTLS